MLITLLQVQADLVGKQLEILKKIEQLNEEYQKLEGELEFVEGIDPEEIEDLLKKLNY